MGGCVLVGWGYWRQRIRSHCTWFCSRELSYVFIEFDCILEQTNFSTDYRWWNVTFPLHTRLTASAPSHTTVHTAEQAQEIPSQVAPQSPIKRTSTSLKRLYIFSLISNLTVDFEEYYNNTMAHTWFEKFGVGHRTQRTWDGLERAFFINNLSLAA